METVSAEVVMLVRQRIGNMGDEEMTQVSRRMAREQPILTDFLMSIGDNIFNTNERQAMIFLGTATWLILSEGKLSLPVVKEETLKKAYDSTYQQIRSLDQNKKSDFARGIAKLFNDSAQPEVTSFLTVEIMEKGGAGELVREENKGYMLLFLKIIVDSFNS